VPGEVGGADLVGLVDDVLLVATISGRSTSLSVTQSITDRFGSVWLDTWEIASPVTSASMCRRSAMARHARNIIRFNTTPI
jgi:hypothetical protein